jgi:hypothetical protein
MRSQIARESYFHLASRSRSLVQAIISCESTVSYFASQLKLLLLLEKFKVIKDCTARERNLLSKSHLIFRFVQTTTSSQGNKFARPLSARHEIISKRSRSTKCWWCRKIFLSNNYISWHILLLPTSFNWLLAFLFSSPFSLVFNFSSKLQNN